MINNQCQFEPSTNTSSATTCKWCGQEKWQHNKTIRNNKQTAVDWLVAKLKSQGLLIGEPKNLVAVRQAKEMQKEQLKDAYYIDRLTADVEIGLDSEFEFNEYYEQNYGSENETDSNRLFP